MFLPNPGVLAAGVGSGKTYEQFLTHITSIAVNGSKSGSGIYDEPDGTYGTRRYVIEDLSQSGTMTGSPWANYFAVGASAYSRIVQHSMPSFDSFVTQIDGARKLFIRIDWDANEYPLFSGVLRNGYQSSGFPSGLLAQASVGELIFWDGVPFIMRPASGVGPEPYDW